MYGNSNKKSQLVINYNYNLANIPMAFMLYLLGIIGLASVYGNNAYNYAIEKIPYFVEISDSASDIEIDLLKEKLNSSKFVKRGSLKYITKDEALHSITDKNLHKDDLLIFGENLLPNSFEFHLNSSFYNQSNYVKNDLMKNPIVVEVFHSVDIFEPVNTTFKRIIIFLCLLTLFFVIISLILISNIIKLTILQNKERINVLFISGVSSDLVVKTYLKKSIYNGILSSFFAIIALIITIFVLHNEIELIIAYADWSAFSFIFSILLLIGTFTYWIGAKTITHRYINLIKQT